MGQGNIDKNFTISLEYSTNLYLQLIDEKKNLIFQKNVRKQVIWGFLDRTLPNAIEHGIG